MRCDLAVIGGGIVGLGVAWAAAKRGMKVAVLERGKLGGSTSAGTFAWLNAASKTDNEAYHRLNAAGLAHYEVLAGRLGRDAIGLCGAGSLQWAQADDPLAAELRRQCAILTEWGYGADLLDRRQMAQLAPTIAFPDRAVGLYAPADRWLEVPQLLLWLRQQIEQQGGSILESREVIGAQSTQGRLAGVMTPSGDLACKAAVVAAGADSPRLLKRLLGREVPAIMRVVPGLLVESRVGAGPDLGNLVAWAPDEAGFHLRPTAAGGLLMGADDIDALVGEGANKDQVAEGVRALCDRAEAWLPRLKAVPWRDRLSWRIGRRAIPADGHSLIGPLAALPGLHLAVTHSGVTLALHLGALLAAQLTGHDCPALTPFAPARLNL